MSSQRRPPPPGGKKSLTPEQQELKRVYDRTRRQALKVFKGDEDSAEKANEYARWQREQFKAGKYIDIKRPNELEVRVQLGVMRKSQEFYGDINIPNIKKMAEEMQYNIEFKGWTVEQALNAQLRSRAVTKKYNQMRQNFISGLYKGGHMDRVSGLLGYTPSWRDIQYRDDGDEDTYTAVASDGKKYVMYFKYKGNAYRFHISLTK